MQNVFFYLIQSSQIKQNAQQVGVIQYKYIDIHEFAFLGDLNVIDVNSLAKLSPHNPKCSLFTL